MEQQAKAVEVELLEQASEREQQLLKVITTLHGEAIEWKQAMMQLILSFQPELKVCCLQLLCIHVSLSQTGLKYALPDMMHVCTLGWMPLAGLVHEVLPACYVRSTVESCLYHATSGWCSPGSSLCRRQLMP